jgi:hypothetical protein
MTGAPTASATALDVLHDIDVEFSAVAEVVGNGEFALRDNGSVPLSTL